MPRVQNGGGTVTADQVTITGSGLPSSPLVAVAQQTPGFPLTFYQGPSIPGAAVVSLANPINTLDLFGVIITAAVQFNKIILAITAGDPANLYDVGLYSNAGVRLAHRGAAGIPATGNIGFVMTGGPFTINPGRYYIATTGNATNAQMTQNGAGANVINFLVVNPFGASVGGVLPANITPPADSPLTNFGLLWALSL